MLWQKKKKRKKATKPKAAVTLVAPQQPVEEIPQTTERFANIPPKSTAVNNFFHIFAKIFSPHFRALNIVVFSGYTTQYANRLLSQRLQ